MAEKNGELEYLVDLFSPYFNLFLGQKCSFWARLQDGAKHLAERLKSIHDREGGDVTVVWKVS